MLAAVAGVLLAGCSLHRTLSPETYTVQRGDTLSSIAADYGLDWHDLARWNRIGPPYRIDVGQTLSLDPYPPLTYPDDARSAGRSGRGRIVRAPQDSRAEQQAAIQASTPQLTRTIEHGTSAANPPTYTDPQRNPPQRQAPGDEDQQAAERAAQAKIEQVDRQSQTAPAPSTGAAVNGWQWPASGSIVRAYEDDRIRRGIDIGGREGSPVYAASGGRVVYNGSGLKGYGKLIIIKHDKHYLTAYGFTQRSLVKEGQDVAVGTHIADMGLGPENKPMVHFEIRRDGEPINPVSLLPEH